MANNLHAKFLLICAQWFFCSKLPYFSLTKMIADDAPLWKVPSWASVLISSVGVKWSILGMVESTEYTECQAFSPTVRIGYPVSSPASECCPPPPLWFRGGHTRLLESGRGSRFGRRDRHAGTLGIIPLRVGATNHLELSFWERGEGEKGVMNLIH